MGLYKIESSFRIECTLEDSRASSRRSASANWDCPKFLPSKPTGSQLSDNDQIEELPQSRSWRPHEKEIVSHASRARQIEELMREHGIEEDLVRDSSH